jgi:CRP-like cAMP-binding protein
MDVLELAGATPAPPAEGPFVAFADWTEEEIGLLRGLGRTERFDAGATVIEAGSATDRDLFVVVSGTLEVHRRAGGTETRVALLGPGDLFGEMSFVDGCPRSASVRALATTRALRVRPEDLDTLARTHPAVAVRFMREVARILSFRLRQTSR